MSPIRFPWQTSMRCLTVPSHLLRAPNQVPGPVSSTYQIHLQSYYFSALPSPPVYIKPPSSGPHGCNSFPHVLLVPFNHSQHSSQFNLKYFSTWMFLLLPCCNKKNKNPLHELWDPSQSLVFVCLFVFSISLFCLLCCSHSIFVLVFVLLFKNLSLCSSLSSRLQVFTITTPFLWNIQHLSLLLVKFSSS